MPATTTSNAAEARPGPARRRTALVAVVALVVLAAVAAVVAVVLTRGTSTAPRAGARLDTRGQRLVWSDEFTGAPGGRLDPAKWAVENESTFGDGNGELACLMDRPANVAVGGGVLRLVARRESPPLRCGSDTRFAGGRGYSSAMISTRGLAGWHTGTFEIRAELPTGAHSQGLWPAFWLRPASSSDGTGEIDVFEAIGSAAAGGRETGVVHQTVWAAGGGSPKKSATVAVPGAAPSAAFHTYAVRWEPDSLTWYVDGRATYRCTSSTAPWLAGALRGRFFMRINLAVGGSWPGAPSASTRLPQAMAVDWVRVYQDGGPAR